MDISTCNIKCVINVTPTKFIVMATFSAYTLIEDENQKESKGRGERDTNRGCFFFNNLGCPGFVDTRISTNPRKICNTILTHVS